MLSLFLTLLFSKQSKKFAFLLPRQFEASTCSFKKSTHIFFTGSIWYWFAASSKDWTLLLLTEILQNRRRKVSTNTYFVGAKTPTYTNWNNGKIIPLLFPLASFSYTQRRHSLPSGSFQIALVCCTLLRKGKQSWILKVKPLTQAIWNTMLITLTCVVNHFYETE